MAERVAFITGAARGIGRATALEFGQRGYNVCLFDVARNVDGIGYDMSVERDLRDAADAVRNAGARAVEVFGDVRKLADMERAIATCATELGSIDALICCAGVSRWALPWIMTEDEWDAIIDVNLKGAWIASRFAIPLMMERGNGGTIVFVSSVSAFHPLASSAPYAASKAGLVAMAKSLAQDVAGFGVRVNTVHPGLVKTGMTSAVQGEQDASEGPPAALKRQILTNDWIPAEAVARCIAWIASPEARYITGQALVVDAGWLLS